MLRLGLITPSVGFVLKARAGIGGKQDAYWRRILGGATGADLFDTPYTKKFSDWASSKKVVHAAAQSRCYSVWSIVCGLAVFCAVVGWVLSKLW